MYKVLTKEFLGKLKDWLGHGVITEWVIMVERRDVSDFRAKFGTEPQTRHTPSEYLAPVPRPLLQHLSHTSYLSNRKF